MLDFDSGYCTWDLNRRLQDTLLVSIGVKSSKKRLITAKEMETKGKTTVCLRFNPTSSSSILSWPRWSAQERVCGLISTIEICAWSAGISFLSSAWHCVAGACCPHEERAKLATSGGIPEKTDLGGSMRLWSWNKTAPKLSYSWIAGSMSK